MSRFLVVIQLCVLALCFSHTAAADPQSKSYSYWRFADNEATMIYSIGSREVTRLPAYQYNADTTAIMGEHLNQTIRLTNNDALCAQTPANVNRAKTGYERFEITFNCSAPIDNATVYLQTLFASADSHVHFARFTPAGKPAFEFLFTPRQMEYSWSLSNEEQASSDTAMAIFINYIVLGFEHILIGLDHIAFLFTLLLLASRLRDVLLVITGFTIGHSVTLSLAVLEFATPNLMVVEALIGFTIALVAIENVTAANGTSKPAAWLSCAVFIAMAIVVALGVSGPPLFTLLGLALFCFCYLRLSDTTEQALKLRPYLTIIFGLIHGFGFANVLLEVGLPQERLLSALFGFNVGVEFGQIAIVLIISAIGVLIHKALPSLRHQWTNQLLSALLCGLGMYWFVQRSFM